MGTSPEWTFVLMTRILLTVILRYHNQNGTQESVHLHQQASEIQASCTYLPTLITIRSPNMPDTLAYKQTNKQTQLLCGDDKQQGAAIKTNFQIEASRLNHLSCQGAVEQDNVLLSAALSQVCKYRISLNVWQIHNKQWDVWGTTRINYFAYKCLLHFFMLSYIL